MKPWYLALALAWGSSPAMAMAVPPSQEAAPLPVRAEAPATARKPLFEVRYVLLKAPATAPDERAIDIVDGGRAMIRPSSVDPSASMLLSGAATAPGALICRGWGCIKPPVAQGSK